MQLDRERSHSPNRLAPQSAPRKLKVLRVFSGPSDSQDGLASALDRLGIECEEWGLLNGAAFDLATLENWHRPESKVRSGCFDAGLLGPPVIPFLMPETSWMAVPCHSGYQQTDTARGAWILDLADQKSVRLGTLLAVAAVLGLFIDQGKPALVVQPPWKQDGRSVSMCNLDEYKAILGRGSVTCHDLVQCEYGARVMKATALLNNRLDLSDLKAACARPKKGGRFGLPMANSTWDLIFEDLQLCEAAAWHFEMPLLEFLRK